MGLPDTLGHVLFDNPISQGLRNLAGIALDPVLKSSRGLAPPPEAATAIAEGLPPLPLMMQAPFVKVAGVLGASAVVLGAYGAHRKYPKDRAGELRPVYETANRFHFLHALALFGVPFCRSPKATGCLFVLGTTLFCGACYHRAFTGRDTFGKLAPIGGTVLILAWISMAV